MKQENQDWNYEGHNGGLRAEVKYDWDRHAWLIKVIVNGEFYAVFEAAPAETKDNIINRIERAYQCCLDGKGQFDWYTGRPNFNKKPVVSKSEWGSFRADDKKDMKVLRKRAEGAVRYFNNGKPRTEMHTNIFGYPFSIIDNGKLSDIDNAYKGNVIIRCLSYSDNGFYKGKVTLSYNDDYNDGRGQGGSGCMLIGDVRDVRIEGVYLVIAGYNNKKPVEYRYLIQNETDKQRIVFPIPRKKSASTSDEGEDDYGDEEEPPEPKPKRTAKEKLPRMKEPNGYYRILMDGEDCGTKWEYENPITGMTASVYFIRDAVTREYKFAELVYTCNGQRQAISYERDFKDLDEVDAFLTDVAKKMRAKKSASKPAPKSKKEEPKPAKPAIKPTEKPKKEAPRPATKTTEKPKKEEPKPAVKPGRTGMIYTVKSKEGEVWGVFPSEAKAKALLKTKKAEGIKGGRIHITFQ